jgi:CDP-6-deoxy-D-xylo-4-hexulose-3-dehydrase
MKTEWPLNVSNFSLLDRIKIAFFFLNSNNFWTMNKKVQEFELKMSEFVQTKHSIFVANGSVANTLIAMRLKDSVFSKTKDTIIFPSTTWITSVSPFLREGFKPKFIDINLEDFCLDLEKTEAYLEKNSKNVACIFVTSLLGFVPNIEKLKQLSEKYKVKIMMDNCENTFGSYENKNISSFFTSTTSTYFGHQLQSVEGGFVFTNDDEEKDYFLMARNHGMTRSLINNDKYLNKNVDPKFDFYLLGNNFRNSDIHAYIGLLDFERIQEYIQNRRNLYSLFEESLDPDKYVIAKNFENRQPVAFCLPIIFKEEDNAKVKLALQFCKNNKIETRPIISGNLLRQTCFEKFDKFTNFKNSEFIHQNGFYIGLHNKLFESQINLITNYLNDI